MEATLFGLKRVWRVELDNDRLEEKDFYRIVIKTKTKGKTMVSLLSLEALEAAFIFQN